MILAGDIGGTHARLTYYRQNADNGDFVAVHEHVFDSREFRGLNEVVNKFVSETGVHPTIATFGIAGPVRNGRVETSNLPWVVESSRLARDLQLDSVNLINDLEAQAWGIQCLKPSDMVALNQVTCKLHSQQLPGGQQAPAGQSGGGRGGNGSGRSWPRLGRKTPRDIRLRRWALRFRSAQRAGDRTSPLPANSLWTRQLRDAIVSGPGLVNVYLFLKDTHRGNEKEPQWLRDEIAAGDPGAAISKAAISGAAPLAEQALDLWISIYGAEAGNMALYKVLATGGIFLAEESRRRFCLSFSGPCCSCRIF